MEMNKENARLTGWFVARDEDGELYLYDCFPLRKKMDGYLGWWTRSAGVRIPLSPDLFPETTWDTEPKAITVALLDGE